MKFFERFYHSWQKATPNFKFFILGIFLLGINQGILNSTFNNYLHDTFSLSADERGFLEFPREFPGFALIFVTALLAQVPIRYWAFLVSIFSFLGVLGLGYLSPVFSMGLLWMFLWSMADHLFMPIESTMGLQLSRANEEGRRLGQISGIRNLAMIFGTLFVWIFFSLLNLSYKPLYLLASLSALIAGIFFLKIRFKKEEEIPSKKFVYRKRYNIFYLLNILFGARKQLFLTFSPWVLISVFHSSTQIMALIIFISSFIGFFFRQYFGIWVDKFGEKNVLMWDSVILLVICLGFAFSKNIYILYALMIIDNLMFATRIARTTYLKKIAHERSDIPTTLSLGVALDHVISMSIPLLGGILWAHYGYPSVFLFASLIALINYFTALKIKV